MNIETKRDILRRYCYSHANGTCENCVVRDREWTHLLSNGNGHKCLTIAFANEEELDQALALIHGDSNKSTEEIREIFGLDPIKPEYYNDTKITPFDVIDDWDLNFYLGNAIKYIKRAGKKADNSKLQDLKKVREYIDHEIKVEEARE